MWRSRPPRSWTEDIGLRRAAGEADDYVAPTGGNRSDVKGAWPGVLAATSTPVDETGSLIYFYSSYLTPIKGFLRSRSILAATARGPLTSGLDMATPENSGQLLIVRPKERRLFNKRIVEQSEAR